MFVILIACIILLPSLVSYCLPLGRRSSIIFRYFSGTTFLLSIYYILALLCTFLSVSLRFFTFFFLSISILLSFFGLYRLKSQHIKIPVAPPSGKVFLIMAMLVILYILQIYTPVFEATYYSGDDAYYVAEASTAIFTDRLNQYSPYTGDALIWPDKAEYTLAPWPILWASFSLISGVHPMILMHTLAPALIILLTYLAYSLVLDKFFHDNEKVLLGLLIIMIINMFSSTPSFSASKSWWLLNVGWYGKCVLPNVALPHILYLLICIDERVSSQRDIRSFSLLLFLACITSYFLASSSFLLIPVFFGCWGLVQAIRLKSIRLWPLYFICILPCFFAIYYIFSN